MADPVFFFFRSCFLMLFDHVVFIVIDRSAGNDPGLRPSLSGFFVNIITWFLFFLKSSFCDPVIQQIMCFLIYLRCIGIGILRELCLRPVNTKEGLRMLCRLLSRLLPVVYIIRQCRYFLCPVRPRTNCTKGSDLCHFFPPLPQQKNPGTNDLDFLLFILLFDHAHTKYTVNCF